MAVKSLLIHENHKLWTHIMPLPLFNTLKAFNRSLKLEFYLISY